MTEFNDLDTLKLGRRRRLTPEQEQWISNQAESLITISQSSLARDASERFHVRVTQQLVSRILHRRGRTKKKLTIEATEQFDHPERHLYFHALLKQVPDEELGAMDETSFWLNDGPRYGWSKKGKFAIVQRSRKRGTKLTLLLCIRMIPKNETCIVSYALHDGSMNSQKFLQFIPTMRQGFDNFDVPFHIILDNGSFHGSPLQLANPLKPTPLVSKIQDEMRRMNLKFIFMRPFSPQFNPTEFIFSSIKRFVRRTCPKTRIE